MEVVPTLDLVYQGIYTLYHNTNPREKEKASKWLEEFQKSIYSWSISHELLQQKRDVHSCYFAAQTMRNKIQNSFNELPVNTHEALRDSLLMHIGQISDDSDGVIVTQLCLAVADLALLMSSWENPVLDLLEKCGMESQATWPLLEILKLIPEEVDSRYLRLGANRRQDINKQMDRSAPKVVEFLCSCLNRKDNQCKRILNSTLNCFRAWLYILAIPIPSIIDSPLIQQVFLLLGTSDTPRKLHETSTDCLCALFNCFEAGNNNDKTSYEQVHMYIFNGVFSLEQAYHSSVVNEDIDKTMNYCRIFTVMCETFLRDMVITGQHFTIKGLELVLMCDGHFDYEVAEITFNLWYRLSEELFERNNDILTSYFKPYIERLLSALYRHAQMDPDHEGLIDESEGFYDFRVKVADLIKDVVFIVGSGNVFKQMFLILQAPDTTWESIESALFVMQNVAKNVMPDENEVVPKVIEAIFNLPENTHITVKYTSIMLLGELCDWIESHPDLLEPTLNFLLYALQQKNGLAIPAAIALTSICSGCRQKMTCHINGLVEIARSLDSFEINHDVAIGLLKGIALILSRLPLDQMETAMREVISFQFQPLAQLVESGPIELIKKGENTDPAYWIDRACAIIRHTDPSLPDNTSHPTIKILTEAWPLISRVLDKYQADLRIMERTTRFIRYGVRMVHQEAVLLVDPLAEQIVSLYKLHHHSCFLYLGSVLCDEFAKNEDCVYGLLQMLQAFIEPTFSMLQVENGMKNNPDTVDDFFRLCSRFMECCPVQFLKSSLVTPICQCALLACALDHREANSSVMKFFSNLLKWGRRFNTRRAQCVPFVKEIAMQNGEALVIQLVHSSIFCLHSYMLPDVADVLTSLRAVVEREHMKRFLDTALNSLPQENGGGCVTATKEQLDDFANDVLTSETTKDVAIALRTFTRLYR